MADKITSSMTVREVMTRYTAAEKVFEKHGLTGCGGPKGPIEPIGFFARVHQADEQTLLRDLNEAATRREEETPQARKEAALGPEFYKVFIKTAIIIALTAGATLGAVILASMALGRSTQSLWPDITQAHGTAQVFGWAGLFIMGVAYHVLPRLLATELRGQALVIPSYGFVVGGILLRLISATLPASGLAPFLLVLAATSLLLGSLLFSVVVLLTRTSSRQKHDLYEKYILASVFWFVVMTASNLALAFYAIQAGDTVIPPVLDSPYLHIGLFGFVTMMILGITLRTVPLFMGLAAPNKPALGIVFWMLNLGIAIKAAAGFAQIAWDSAYLEQALVGGAVLEYAGVIGYVYFLNLFRKPIVEPEEGVSRSYEKFVRAAYLWLLVAATMTTAYALYQAVTGQEVAHALVGSYRHALTVGFISMMILGMAYRIIPVFTGSTLHSPLLLLGSFVLLNGGNLIRVVSQPLAEALGGPFYPLMGISGFMEVTALSLFGYNIWKTVDKRMEEEALPSASAGPIAKDMVVADVLRRLPPALDLLVSYGFTPLKNPIARRTLARAITLEQAARMQSVDLDRLLADLNRLYEATHGPGSQQERATTADEKQRSVLSGLEAKGQAE